ncbi:Lcl C-terminal domain-containing protein [Thiohalomonas denitrificans]|uniref:Lcl C-terminal domain-containing protein n=1 Tax=Thiohalomonas denitrificans TaxID=415747 RepID=A0A1G5QM84_9GAMM|nr:DUF1566 domain-containing protein [Thiohalomonas denitrificans]SCZ62718.1 Protein of unknown function [Thiohalomonas denitrificans]
MSSCMLAETNIRLGVSLSCGVADRPHIVTMDTYPETGQRLCYDTEGGPRPCDWGEDAEIGAGSAWPEPRFVTGAETVLDHLTGLTWTQNANLAEFPLTWEEALEFVADVGLGHSDWRLPNRRELRSLLSYQTHRPALPRGHPFTQLFPGWYWSSTSAAISPAHAWYVHMDGGRMFYGGKDQSFMVWPVRGEGNGLLSATGQTRCYDEAGRPIPCSGSGQDGEHRMGRTWPEPRFVCEGDALFDRLAGLVWHRNADLAQGAVNWQQALEAVQRLRVKEGKPWRLPNVNELELLVDCDHSNPALPAGANFDDLGEGYWSATTSVYEPDWAWALYMAKGAIGVGQKRDPHFQVMAVRDGASPGVHDSGLNDYRESCTAL